MKSNTVFTLILSMCLYISPLMAYAGDTDGNVSTGSSAELRPKVKKGFPQRPGMPSRQMIVCTYNGEELMFDFTLSEGLCEVTLTDLNTSMSRYYTIDSSELSASIYVGTIGESEIEISTELGNTYTGNLLSE